MTNMANNSTVDTYGIYLIISGWTALILNNFYFYFKDFLFKFLIIGRAGVGKSCILNQFIENKCNYFNSIIISLFRDL